MEEIPLLEDELYRIIANGDKDQIWSFVMQNMLFKSKIKKMIEEKLVPKKNGFKDGGISQAELCKDFGRSESLLELKAEIEKIK